MSIVKCMPVEPIVLKFNDGTILKCYINIKAIGLLIAEFGDFENVVKQAEEEPFTFYAKLLYAGIKVNKTSFTLEEAESIICSNCGNLIEELTDAYIRCCGDVGGEDFSKKYIAKIEEYLAEK
ncbi:hypothetical protein CS063_13765 [Sporanaerobium hydrogeniformans]|uniref:Uncharacterized protein n=1 Tax=Sporanaerobium hydrogeniformans TaxID=3072179 RepID=A0AC61D943_9FIRM|nr:hypothetical protein [Sporanaerobium hydrogeniformans]PHV69780.1 hypothetical protein CS063_13765 [Sporanaerobium hydrogeniformans]